jgi:hypothetical protein
MRRFIFAVVVLGSAPAAAGAQRVPARDLLDLPLGTLAEPVALAGTVGDGLWNPATTALPTGTRARIALAALTTPAAQGVGAQALSAVVGVRGRTTVGIGVARASMRDIQRTGTDPQTLGEIRYNTTVASASATHQWRWVAGGVAARYRTGELDLRRRATLGLDAGVVGRVPRASDLRVAVSSYMWTFGATRDDRPAIAAAADLRLGGTSELRELRSGYSLVATRGLGRDDYLHLGGRSGRYMLRAGVLRATAYDVVTWGSRLGVGLQHARYMVGFAREERTAGLPPSYQFTLTTSFK